MLNPLSDSKGWCKKCLRSNKTKVIYLFFDRDTELWLVRMYVLVVPTGPSQRVSIYILCMSGFWPEPSPPPSTLSGTLPAAWCLVGIVSLKSWCFEVAPHQGNCHLLSVLTVFWHCKEKLHVDLDYRCNLTGWVSELLLWGYIKRLKPSDTVPSQILSRQLIEWNWQEQTTELASCGWLIYLKNWILKNIRD